MGILEQGTAVLGTANGVTLAGMSQAAALNAFMAGTPVGQLVGEAGMRLAALGGKLTKGVLVWKAVEMGQETRKAFAFPMNPDELTDQSAPEYAKRSVPGQNRPLYSFINGGERTLDFKLHFFYSSENRAAIRNQIQQLQSLTQRPERQATEGGAAWGPPTVNFYFGQFHRGERWLVGKVHARTFDLYDPLLLLPLRAEVEVQLIHAPDPQDPAGENRLRVSFGEQRPTTSSLLTGGL